MVPKVATPYSPLALALVLAACAETPPQPRVPEAAPAPAAQPRVAFVVVLDRSGSMSGPPIEEAKGSVLSVGRFLGPRDEIGVVLADPEPSVLVPVGVPGPTFEDRLSALQIGGTQAIGAGLQLGLSEASRSGAERRVLVLISDFGLLFPHEIEAFERRRATLPGLEVVVFLLGRSADKALLRELAERSRVFVLEDPEALGPRLGDEVRRLLGRAK